MQTRMPAPLSAALPAIHIGARAFHEQSPEVAMPGWNQEKARPRSIHFYATGALYDIHLHLNQSPHKSDDSRQTMRREANSLFQQFAMKPDNVPDQSSS